MNIEHLYELCVSEYVKLDVEADIVELPIEVKTALSSDILQKCTNYRVALSLWGPGPAGMVTLRMKLLLSLPWLLLQDNLSALWTPLDKLARITLDVDIALSNYIKLYLVNLFCTSPRKIS